jgi:putative transposase
LDICVSEVETFWTDFLRKLTRRSLRGVKLVISDAHEGLKAAAAKVLGATWRSCRVHFMRNALAHANKNGRRRFGLRTTTPQRLHHAGGMILSLAEPTLRR